MIKLIADMRKDSETLLWILDKLEGLQLLAEPEHHYLYSDAAKTVRKWYMNYTPPSK